MSMATCLRRSFLGLAAAGLCGTALAEPPNTALSVGFDAEGNFRYTQDFNSLAPQGSSQRWVDGVTLRGWQLRNFVEQSLVTPSLKLDHGLSSSGSFYSYVSVWPTHLESARPVCKDHVHLAIDGHDDNRQDG